MARLSTGMRIERIKILAETDRLEKERCEKCKSSNPVPKACCPANIRILELGDELLRLTRPKPLDKSSPLYRQQFTKWLKIAEENGLPYTTFSSRVNKGVPFEKAATTPINQRKKKVEKPKKHRNKLTEEQINIVEANGLDRRQVYWRIRQGWTVENAISARPSALYKGKPVKAKN